MNKAMIIDVVPRKINGETIYVQTDLRGLGVVNTTAITTATNVVNTASAVASAIPTKPVTVQSDFSKGANVVATGASVIAAATVYLVPYGTVIAAIAGIVAAAAALLGKIFANSKAKAYAAERGEYEKANAAIKFENLQMDEQYGTLNKAIEELRSVIGKLGGGIAGPSLSGLGLCLWNCKDEKKKLQSAKDEYEALKKEQENKTKIMASLLDEYNKLLKAAFELKADKKTKDWLMWIFLGAAVVGGGYLLVTKSK